MVTTTSQDPQRRNIKVYFLAAPEDQNIYEEIHKHLSPIIKRSSVPIEVNSDFNIPSGADREKYKQKLLEADVVLALISIDFIDNDDIYNRNQKVIERYNKHETVMIPILVRNFMWKSTPFSSLPVVPKNLQPLNNRQFWNSPDDAVMSVVSDIYGAINELAQSEALQPPSVAETVSVPDLNAPAGISISQPEPSTSVTELPQPQSEAVQTSPAVEVESAPPLEVASEHQVEPSDLAPELAQAQSEAVQPLPATEVKSTPELKAPSTPPISQTRASSPIAVDWRKKYYRTVLLKRAGAILLDHLIIVFVPLVLLVLLFPDIPDGALTAILYIMYLVVMPMMESSKRQGTIGKRILKLQITDRDGERISFFRALWRNVMRSLVLYLYFISFGVLLLVQYFRFRKTRKLFHDELSGTVIGERLAGSAEVSIAAGNEA